MKLRSVNVPVHNFVFHVSIRHIHRADIVPNDILCLIVCAHIQAMDDPKTQKQFTRKAPTTSIHALVKLCTK